MPLVATAFYTFETPFPTALQVSKTPNAENPWVHGATPILTMDVW